MRSLTRSHRRRKSLQSSDRHWVPAIESLESRALLAAVYPVISLNNQQPVILPVVNGKIERSTLDRKIRRYELGRVET